MKFQINELAVTTPKEKIVKRLELYNLTLPANAPLDMLFNIAYIVPEIFFIFRHPS